MRVVVAEHSLAILIVQSQAVPDTVGNVLGRFHSLRLHLDRVACCLLQDAAVQVKKRLEAWIGSHHAATIISADDMT